MAMPNVKNPINTYGGMKDAVALWIDRDDDEFVNQIPNFINFAEKEIYRNLRIPAFEKEVQLTIRNGVAQIPSDLLEVKYMFDNDSNKFLRATSPEEIDFLHSGNAQANHNANQSTFSRNEIVFTRLAGRFVFYPQVSKEITIGYWADQKELIEDTDSNVLLTIAPELLLYYSLRHACMFVSDDAGIAKWTELGKQMLDEIVTQAANLEYSGSPLVIPNTSDMYSGRSSFGFNKFTTYS